MNILFNLSVTQPVGNIKRHGGGIYGEIILERIIERGLPVVCYYDSKRWINPVTLDKLNSNNIKLFDIRKCTLDNIVKEMNIEILYSPLYIGLDKFEGCKIKTTIHGLRNVETPYDLYFFYYESSLKDKIKFILGKYFSFIWNIKIYNSYKRIASKPNLEFATVSYHSQSAFIAYFPELFSRTNIPVYYSPSTIPTKKVYKSEITEKYFLMVSGCIWTKNNLRAIIAFDKLFSSNLLPGFKVIITGIKSPSLIKYKLKNQNRFIIKGYVDDNELHQLYHDAYCFVYPSLNEGFGYPPIEAMYHGVPIIASSFTSIPEVCGDAALYFNPYNIEEISNRILQISKEKMHDEMKQKSNARYKYIEGRQRKDLDGMIDYIYEL